MADIMNPQQRSNAMSKVRGQETKIERLVRSELHKKGFRFRKNVKALPGKPDIVFPKYKTIIFVNGCFWHGHKGCKASKLPETRKEFWKNKIAANISRDKKNIATLRKDGWNALVVWQCEISNQEKLARRLATLIDEIKNGVDLTYEY